MVNKGKAHTLGVAACPPERGFCFEPPILANAAPLGDFHEPATLSVRLGRGTDGGRRSRYRNPGQGGGQRAGARRRHRHRRPALPPDSHLCRQQVRRDRRPGRHRQPPFAAAVDEVQKRQNRKPRTTGDFRRLIDDKEIDALVVGTPDHWHAIPTILACQAGKDVYVEKPDGHNIGRGQAHGGGACASTSASCRWARSTASTTRHAIGHRVHPLGRARPLPGRQGVGKHRSRAPSAARPTASRPRASITTCGSARRRSGRSTPIASTATGAGSSTTAPATWATTASTGSTWPSPPSNAACEAQRRSAARRCRTAIYASGGKWYFDDAQEFPDTLQVNYEYGGKTPKLLTYEMRIWAPYHMDGESEGAAVYGDQGYIVLGNSRWRAYGPGGKLVKEVPGDSHERPARAGLHRLHQVAAAAATATWKPSAIPRRSCATPATSRPAWAAS